MKKSFHLEDIEKLSKQYPRTFLAPSDEEVSHLKTGELVRLIFVFDFKTEDNSRAERMWVEISEIDGENFKGHLTNQPNYIKDLEAGAILEFHKSNIATILTEPPFNEKLKAIITQRALNKRQINWVLKDEPMRKEDSGWQFFYGDEDDDYLEDVGNCKIISLENVLSFEPRLEKVLGSSHHAFEWDDELNAFVKAEK